MTFWQQESPFFSRYFQCAFVQSDKNSGEPSPVTFSANKETKGQFGSD